MSPSQLLFLIKHLTIQIFRYVPQSVLDQSSISINHNCQLQKCYAPIPFPFRWDFQIIKHHKDDIVITVKQQILGSNKLQIHIQKLLKRELHVNTASLTINSSKSQHPPPLSSFSLSKTNVKISQNKLTLQTSLYFFSIMKLQTSDLMVHTISKSYLSMFSTVFNIL
jgi:hypothetical protein